MLKCIAIGKVYINIDPLQEENKAIYGNIIKLMDNIEVPLQKCYYKAFFEKYGRCKEFWNCLN